MSNKKILLLLVSFITSICCGQQTLAQIKLTPLDENAFAQSNLQLVLDGNKEVALLSRECVVLNGKAEIMQLVYLPKADRTIDFSQAYIVLGEVGIIKFLEDGTVTAYLLDQTGRDGFFISKDGQCGYTPIPDAKDATLRPYILEDKRGEETETYAVVKLGNKIWMRENLRTALFQDGTPIKTGLDKKDWEATKAPAVTYYDGDASNRTAMGALYNWYAVTETTTPLAPKGWQVPSANDWKAIVKYLDPNGFMPDEYDNPSILSLTAGVMLKSKEGWTHSPSGKPEDIVVGNNLSQLDIKPFGSTSTSKYFNGYSGKGLQAYLWSCTQSDYEATKGEFFRLFWDQKVANFFFEDKFMGYSVRCILNTPIQLAEAQPIDPTALTVDVATAGTLASQLSEEQKQSVSQLTLEGTLDARDFAALRQLAKLSDLTLKEVKIEAYRGDGGPIAGVKKYPENELPAESFKGNTTLSSFKATGEINSLGANCFEGCARLSQVVLPEALTEFNGSNFKNCTSLQTLTLHDGITDLGASTFEGCSSLAGITLPGEIEELGDSLFKDCKSLASITIPNSVTSIGMSTFENCSTLTQIEIPDAIETLGMFAFQGCTALQTATLGNGITEVDYGTFLGDYALKSVTLPNNLETIGAFSFQGCTALKTLTIPQKVKKIANGAFRSTAINFTLPEGSLFEVKDEMLLSKDGKTIYYVPNTFRGEVVIPNGIETINGAAFSDCKGVSKAHLPASIREIKLMAFENTSLYQLTLDVVNPSDIKLGEDVFGKTMDYSRCELFVPETSVEAYKATEPWNLFDIKAATALTSPTSEFFQISLEGRTLQLYTAQRTVFSLSSMQGEKLLQGTLQVGSNPIETAQLPSGVYLLGVGENNQLILLP